MCCVKVCSDIPPGTHLIIHMSSDNSDTDWIEKEILDIIFKGNRGHYRGARVVIIAT